jgi:hypothetical protein
MEKVGGDTIGGSTQIPVTNIYLTPVAYTKIQIRKINPHSPGLSLVVNIKPDPSSFNYGSINAFGQPADTTVVMASYGYTNNILSWHLATVWGTLTPRNGRTASRLLYQSLRYGIYGDKLLKEFKIKEKPENPQRVRRPYRKAIRVGTN